MNKLAVNLAFLLQERGISQTQLADFLNIKQQTISKYLHKISEPSLDTVIQIARYFDVSTDYLLGLEE